MKKRHLPLLWHYLTVNSRKNRLFAGGVFLFFLLISTHAFTDTLDISVSRGNIGLSVTVLYQLDPSPSRIEPIESGLKSRIVFTIQYMERREGLFFFLGDIVLSELAVEYTGYKDFLEDTYILEDSRGRKMVFKTPAEFFQAFTRLQSVPLDTLIAPGNDGHHYLRAQVRYFPVKLLAPLTLVYILSPGDVIESGWQQVALP
jgi:hypothetical protein